MNLQAFRLLLLKKYIYIRGSFSRFCFLLKRPILRNLSEWLLPSNLTRFAFMLKSHCIIIISISNDISEFTEHLRGSNKVCYPISGRNDFTVLLRSVVGRQNYIYEKYPLYTIYDVFL